MNDDFFFILIIVACLFSCSGSKNTSFPTEVYRQLELCRLENMTWRAALEACEKEK
jgi:hypothetical protein